jgi:HPP family
MSNYPTPAAVRTTAAAPVKLPNIADLFRGRSATRIVDMVWTPGVCAALVIVVGAVGYWLHQPWLFAGLGPSILLVASNPGHETARFRSIVVGHLVAIGCAYLALLLLNATSAPSLLAAATMSMPRVWASAGALAMVVLVQPQLRAYHPPAAATALLVTSGAYRMTGKTPLALMAGVLLVAIAAELLQYARAKRV